jgi:hypothetical protein
MQMQLDRHISQSNPIPAPFALEALQSEFFLLLLVNPIGVSKLSTEYYSS